MEEPKDKVARAILQRVQVCSDIRMSGYYVPMPEEVMRELEDQLDGSLKRRFGIMEHWIKLSAMNILMPKKTLFQ